MKNKYLLSGSLMLFICFTAGLSNNANSQILDNIEIDQVDEDLLDDFYETIIGKGYKNNKKVVDIKYEDYKGGNNSYDYVKLFYIISDLFSAEELIIINEENGTISYYRYYFIFINRIWRGISHPKKIIIADGGKDDFTPSLQYRIREIMDASKTKDALKLFIKKQYERAEKIKNNKNMHIPSEILLNEDFSDNSNNWPIYDDEDRYLQIKNGRYYIQSKKEEHFKDNSYPIYSTNYIIRLNVRYEKGNDKHKLGDKHGGYILFRRSGNKKYYVSIISDPYYFSQYLVFSKGTEGDNFWNCIKTDAIKSNKDNRIEIINIYEKMYLYINGRLVFEKNILISNNNHIGIGSRASMYSFDNLQIIILFWKLNIRMPKTEIMFMII